MKLEEALRKIIRQFGVSVLQEKRLMFILSDFRAFNDHPAVNLDDDSEGCLSFARSLKMSLAEDRHFKQELADYAVDSITFAMGLQTTVMEPADHGFDPMENGNSADHVREEERKESDSGVRAESHSPDARVQEQHPHMEKPKPAGSSSVAKVNAPGTVAQADAGSVKKSSPFRMKWLAVLVLIAGAFAFGKLSSGGSGQPEPVQVQVQPAQEITAGNAAQESAVTRNNDSAEDDVQAVMTADQQSGMYEYDQGWNYERGLGVRQDYAEALKWYRKAAELGNKEARIRIEAVETLISRDKKGFSPVRVRLRHLRLATGTSMRKITPRLLNIIGKPQSSAMPTPRQHWAGCTTRQRESEGITQRLPNGTARPLSRGMHMLRMMSLAFCTTTGRA